MSVRVLALVLGLCALAQAVPIYKRRPLLEDKRAVVEIYDQLEKRGSKSSIAQAVEKRSPIEKRAVVEIYDQLEKRGSKSSIAEGVEKRSPIEKRAVVEIYDQLEKRGSKSSVAEAVEKRSLPTLSIQTQPTLTYYQYDVPSTQVLYYYVLPDGSIQYMKGSSQVQVQQPQVQITQPIAQLPQLQISQPVAQESSSGGLLSFLQKPLTAAGNIIQKTGDVASDIISLPFSAGREVVAGVGLDDTAVGKLATGILNVGEGIEQTKLNILSNVAQAPFRLGADIAGAFDEEE